MVNRNLLKAEMRKLALAFLQLLFPEKQIKIEAVIENQVFCFYDREETVVYIDEENEKVYAQLNEQWEIKYFNELQID